MMAMIVVEAKSTLQRSRISFSGTSTKRKIYIVPFKSANRHTRSRTHTYRTPADPLSRHEEREGNEAAEPE